MMRKIQIHFSGSREQVELVSHIYRKVYELIQTMDICEIAYGEITLKELRKTKKVRRRKT